MTQAAPIGFREACRAIVRAAGTGPRAAARSWKILVRAGGEAPRGSGQVQNRQQAEQADDDQVQRDDVVEQARPDQDQDAGDERDQRLQCGVDVHELSPEMNGYRKVAAFVTGE